MKQVKEIYLNEPLARFVTFPERVPYTFISNDNKCKIIFITWMFL